MTSKDKGRKLENFICELFKDLDSKSRPTVGSGNSKEVADIINKYFYIEAKKRNTKDITIKSDVWNKLCSEISIGSLKTPLYILQNIKNETFVVLDVKDFVRVAKAYIKEN